MRFEKLDFPKGPLLMKVAVAALVTIGLPLAVQFAASGHEVVAPTPWSLSPRLP
ncbi:hypothetical protein DAD186_15280 [Dermabacter vaginalis]|uniref:Uncharacterized protein n=1 Tax=Dermabacter vaginalis TaxID=1630135 RepID=A0A1B0ZJL4_9MICO|nr:hypothetical protein DAD186_15280 [Dermabacter vaginalis]